MILSDLHTHTKLSVDGSETVDALCRAALDRGLSAIAITDHWDTFPPGMKDPGYEPHFMDSRDFYLLHEAELLPAIQEARERYGDRLQIVYGVELGQPQLFPEEARAFLDARDFDFVLTSQHLNGEGQDYYLLNYDELDPVALMHECFAQELQLVKSGVADAVGHIDQPVRLMKNIAFDLSLKAYRDDIAALFEEMIRRDIPLEFNTHGLRNWYGRISPPEWTLPLYRDLGGRLVTLGSDAHLARDVGAGIREAAAIAEANGLQPVSYFVRHEPIIL